MLAVAVRVEVRPAERVVDELRGAGHRHLADEVVPRRGDGANLIVSRKPLELVQEQAGLARNDVGGQCGALGVVEEHHARPVFLFVLGLHGTEKLDVVSSHVVVLHAHDGVLVVAQLQQFGDVGSHQHVAVHEHRPALVAAQIGHQEAREGEISRFDGRAFASVKRGHVLLDERGNRDGTRRMPQDGVREHVVRDGLVVVVSDEHANHVVLHTRVDCAAASLSFHVRPSVRRGLRAGDCDGLADEH